MISEKVVERLFDYCHLQPDELQEAQNIKPIKVEGTYSTFQFHPLRLKETEKYIDSLLQELPLEFFKDGSSYLQLCLTRELKEWTTEFFRCEYLMALGLALNKIVFVFPRGMWQLLPCGLPIIQFVGVSPHVDSSQIAAV